MLTFPNFFKAVLLWRPLLAFAALIMGVLWSLGFALVTVGHFNILSIAVIPMVLGIGIDFGIQILGRYEEELGHGRSIEQAIAIALEHTGVAIITGGSTTAAAFFTLCFNDFVGLAELGVIAGCSMVFCMIANLSCCPRSSSCATATGPAELAGAVEQLGLALHPRLGPLDGAHALALDHHGRRHLHRLGGEPARPALRL